MKKKQAVEMYSLLFGLTLFIGGIAIGGAILKTGEYDSIRMWGIAIFCFGISTYLIHGWIKSKLSQEALPSDSHCIICDSTDCHRGKPRYATRGLYCESCFNALNEEPSSSNQST